MALTSSGIGSGLDIDSLVTQLVTAEGQGPKLRIDRKEATIQADLSAFGQLKSALSEFKSALVGLNNDSSFQARSSVSSNADLFTASASFIATESSYKIEVLGLVQAEKVRSDSFAAADETVGTGTLDISLGVATFQVVVDATNNKLVDIKDAINNAVDNPGITASIVNVDTGPQLVLTSNDKGAANTITVAAVDDNAGDGFDLTRLDTANLTVVDPAQDASFMLDGQLVTRGSNSISDVITGVTLNLNKAEIGTVETLTISLDESGVKEKVNKVISAYNNLADVMKNLAKYDPETKTAAILQGDPMLRGIESTLRRIMSDSQDGLAYGSLAALGIKTDERGHLNIDSSKFDKIMSEDFTAISQLFVGDEGLVNRLDQTLSSYLGFGGMLDAKTDALKSGVDRLADDRERLSDRLIAIEKRMRRQFNAMDTLLGQLQGTSTFLTQQLDNLPGSVRKTK
jgi:flagellar hook-associated protein 2